MPVFQHEPDRAWCELRFYEIVELPPGASHTFERRATKEKLIVGVGKCTISYAGKTLAAEEGTNLDLREGDAPFVVTDIQTPTTIIRMAGHWGDEVGGSGLFSVKRSDHPQDNGDPINYAKETNFDRHYHDCDEYWIIFQGSGVALSENKPYEVQKGDCVATGMGHHHDFPLVHEPVRAVYFETTLEGQKRLGHLWNHTHNAAQPKLDRV
jgi:mannose-6-phosphate isomerase-like protein (cupin superfamily)